MLLRLKIMCVVLCVCVVRQSNMDFSVAGVYNASAECAAASNPQLRLFKATRKTSSVPLYELSAPPISDLNWSPATPETVCGPQWQTSLDRSTGFSAACFFYAQELQEKLQVPVGAVHTAWGGTNIEVCSELHLHLFNRLLYRLAHHE
jgi:sialate O-acetylesterase